MLALQLFLVVVLIAATAVFVATEFAIVKIRPSQVDQMVLNGRRNALAVRKVTSNLDGYLSACQLGITITALGLGWLGEPAIANLFEPLFEQLGVPGEAQHVLAFIIAFSLVTFLHVVIGELAPKTLAIQKAEAVSIALSPIIIFFYKVMYPAIWLLNGSANRLIRLFGLKPAKEHEEAHSEDELRLILADSFHSGKINKTEFGYVNRIFDFDELLAREIMVPRTDMVCLRMDDTLEDNLRVIKEEQYTRFPVIGDSKDHIVGMMNTKEFFLHKDEPGFSFNKLVHPVMIVPEATPVNNVLKHMQQKGAHLAVLVDEYGGTSGMITIEDILEEIVGEIRDEFDSEERKEIEYLSEDCVVVDGKAPLHRINEALAVELEDEDHDTIGGWLYGHHSELRKGSEWQYGNLLFKVLEKDKHRIRKIEIVRLRDEHIEETNQPGA